ncbi:MAG: hypothetical protein GC151_00820 [Betaproteobacteria bacterium]|nr:hypothetical protein [Betaproteobacteria bacterium]
MAGWYARIRAGWWAMALAWPVGLHAQDTTDRTLPDAVLRSPAALAWFRAHFTAAELKALAPDAIRTEVYMCSCEDRPTPHYPYALVVYVTPKEDLIARAEGHEGEMSVVPLAQRQDMRYCALDTPNKCYGTFRHPCDFSDFRYGRTLVKVFPDCRSVDR